MSIPSYIRKNYKNNVSISDIVWYEHKYENTTEIINTYERMYYVSHGHAGDEAPQGGADKAGLLGFINGELSTAWERDHREGVLDINNHGVPDTAGELTFMNKCRGRFIFDTYKEYTPVPGSIWEKERKQAEMYNMAISKTRDYGYFENIKLPFLEQSAGPLFDTYFSVNDLHRNINASSGTFMNTVIMPLAELVPQDKYSPGGHLYVPVWAHPTYCGNKTFYYGFLSVSADSSADLTKYSADTNSMTQAMTGPFTLKGLGTLAVDPRNHEEAVEEGSILQNYLFTVNEVSRYAAGEYYLDFRLAMMSYLIHYVYPRYFNRDTGNRVFDSEITDLLLGPDFRCLKYFPNTTKGWYDGWDRELVRFNLYGGVKGRYWGPDFGGDPDPSDAGDLTVAPLDGQIPWF